jgi:hypothetical protein
LRKKKKEIKKKEKIGKLKKKVILKNKKKLAKKRGETMDYCYNPQCFVWGNSYSPHGLEYVVINMRNQKPNQTKLI